MKLMYEKYKNFNVKSQVIKKKEKLNPTVGIKLEIH